MELKNCLEKDYSNSLERSDNQSKLAIDKLVSYLKGFKLEDKVYTSNIILNDYVNQGYSTFKDPNCIDYDEETIEALYTILNELDQEGTIVYRVSSPPPPAEEADIEGGVENRVDLEAKNEIPSKIVEEGKESSNNTDTPKVTASSKNEEQKVIRGGNLEDDLENDEMDEITRAKMIKKLIKNVIASNNIDDVEGKEDEAPLEQTSLMSSLSDSLFIGNPTSGKDTATTTTAEELLLENKNSDNQSDNVDTDKRNNETNDDRIDIEEVKKEESNDTGKPEEIRPSTNHLPKSVKKQRTKRSRKIPKVSSTYANPINSNQRKNLVDEFRQYIATSRVSPVENTKKYIDFIKGDVESSIEQVFPEMKEIFTVLSKDPFNERSVEEMTKKVSLFSKKQNDTLRIHQNETDGEGNKRAERTGEIMEKALPSLFYQQTLESILDGMNAIRSLQSNCSEVAQNAILTVIISLVSRFRFIMCY
jgi:hypothetical protein